MEINRNHRVVHFWTQCSKQSHPVRAHPRRRRRRRDVYRVGWGTHQRCGLLHVVWRFLHVTCFLWNGLTVGEFNAAFPYQTTSLRRNRGENTVRLNRQQRTCASNKLQIQEHGLNSSTVLVT